MGNWLIALRTLARRPGFALTAVLTLALGIGATSALFSLVDTVLLKPLPYPHADRLVTILEASPSKNKKESLVAPGRIEDWNRMSQTFESISGQYTENVTDTSGAEPQRLSGRRVAPRFFDVYGAAPIIGRTFTPDEERDGGPGAVVISYALWTARYGQNPDVTSKRLILGGKRYAIVGVMPKEFAAPSIDVWIPAQINPFLMRARDARFFSGVGRMKPGVTIEQAQADLARVQRQLGEQFPKTDKDWSAIVGDLKEYRVGSYRRTLLLVFGAVGVLLAIAIANIAGLTLAQLHQRERELAIRGSVGASRFQVVAMVMREVVLIAIAGAALGSSGALIAVKLMASAFAGLPRIPELAFDWRALAFATLVSLAASLVFGMIPAFQATRADMAPVLAETGRSISGSRRLMQRGLVVAQLALTVLLLSSAGLLLRSYYNLTRADAGFRTDHAITFHIGAAWDEDRPRIGQMQRNLLSALAQIPGVEAAGFTNFLPATGATLNSQATLEGLADTEQGSIITGYRNVTPGYMQALEIPLLSGHWCESNGVLDFTKPKPTQAMVNRRFVDVYGKGANLIGRHLRFSALAAAPPTEIVGVVGDVREDGLSAGNAPYVYECQLAGSWPDPEYVVRTRADAAAMIPQIRAAIHQVEPGRAVFGMKPLDSLIDDALEQPRLNSRFLLTFAIAAMLLASVGLYSLISLIVTARTREIGVRMALGAGRAQIMRLVFAGAGRMLAGGIVLGAILTVAAERVVKSLLFGVSPLDLMTLGAALLILSLVTAIATLLPASRAARVDPLEAMRVD
jgi:putative ABC transport system permease protein